jgi:catechol 2,3-dioxygenase-like lactoylglutathione lyase family enzyme
MTSQFGHLQINIDPANLGFYRDLFNFLAWSTIVDEDCDGSGGGMLGVGDAKGASLWFGGYGNNGAKNDYDGIGVNHIALSVAAQKDVDAAADFLTSKQVEHLFETPRHRPDFGMDDSQTYYQVMFKSPDNLLFEIVYIGPKDE